MRTHGLVALLAATLTAITGGRAQTSSTPQAPAAPTKPPLVHTQIDLGYVTTSGNTDVRTLNAAEQVVLRPGAWVFTQTFAIVNGSTGDVETANNLKAGLRAERTVGAGFRLYALGTFYRNRFAGVARQFDEVAGVSYGVLPGPTHALDVELGAGGTEQTGTDGTSRRYATGRVAARYRYTFATSAYAEQKAELISDLQDFGNEMLNTETTLTAPLSSNIALKVGYTVRYASQPQPTFKKTDTVLSVGVQLQF
jgi:putative salt-induced outer membrane protein YdiY